MAGIAKGREEKGVLFRRAHGNPQQVFQARPAGEPPHDEAVLFQQGLVNRRHVAPGHAPTEGERRRLQEEEIRRAGKDGATQPLALPHQPVALGNQAEHVLLHRLAPAPQGESRRLAEHVDVVRRLQAEQNVDHCRVGDAVSQADARRGEGLAESPQHDEIRRAAPHQFDGRATPLGVGELAVGLIHADQAGKGPASRSTSPGSRTVPVGLLGEQRNKQIGVAQRGQAPRLRRR